MASFSLDRLTFGNSRLPNPVDADSPLPVAKESDCNSASVKAKRLADPVCLQRNSRSEVSDFFRLSQAAIAKQVK